MDGRLRAQVFAWDTSDLLPSYALVRLALLDDPDVFFVRLPDALGEQQIDHADLRTWPVFAEMRAEARFAALMSA